MPRVTLSCGVHDGLPARVHETTPAAAPQLVLRLLRGRDVGPSLVGITGRVGSGKSTLAGAIRDLAGEGLVLSTDDYLPDYDEVAFEHRDDPAYAALAELAGHLAELRSTGAATVPTWSFKTHRREGTRPVSAGGLVICEGIHALHSAVSSVYDLRVYVHADADTRWSRWEAIELAGERGWGVEKAREHFDRVAEPTFARHEASYRAAADVIVIHG